MIFYNDMLHKACQVHYIDGQIEEKNKIVHTHMWNLPNLFKNVHHDIVLCMAQGDESLEENGTFKNTWCGQTKFEFAQIPQNIKKWFCIHAKTKNPIIQGVPCGLMKNNFGDLKPAIDALRYPFDRKNRLLYVNFNPRNHVCRHQLLQHFSQKPWATTYPANRHSSLYFPEMAQHKFTLCPPGIGVDCYRTWEALYLGSIPIVLPGAHHHFKELPILELELSSWYRLSPEWLNQKWEEFKRKEWNWNALTEEYWIGKVYEAANCL